MVHRVHRASGSRPADGASTSCAATSPTSTSGAPSTSRSSASSVDAETTRDAASAARDPCLEPSPRPAAAGAERIRVVELLATGTNGGAQEHVLAAHAHRPARYDVSASRCPTGSAVEAPAGRHPASASSTRPDDAIAVGALAAHLARCGPTSSTATCTAPRSSAPGRPARRRRPARGRTSSSTIHSSRASGHEETATCCVALTPSIDRLIAVCKAIVAKMERRGSTGRRPSSSSTTASTWTRYDHTEACCTLPEEYGLEPGSQIVGVVARLEPEKGHTTLLEAWPSVLRAVPGRVPAHRRRGRARPATGAREPQARETRGIAASRSCSPAAARTCPPSPPRWMSRSCRRIARRRVSSSSRRWRSSRPSWPPTSAASRR